MQKLDAKSYDKMIDLVIDYRINDAVNAYFNNQNIYEFEEVKNQINQQDANNIKNTYVNHDALLVNVNGHNASVITKSQADNLFEQLKVQIHTIK